MSSIASNDSRSATISPGWDRLPPEYAIPEHAPSIAEAQAYCRRLARSHYENFSVATWFLPERLRQHFFNIYAYCRISDDLGDEVGDPQCVSRDARPVAGRTRCLLCRQVPGTPSLLRSKRPSTNLIFRSSLSTIC